jgi:hypothetical protein
MTPKSERRMAKFFALVKRYNQIGALLPAEEDIDTDDAAQVAEVEVILAEMNKTKAQMDALLERERKAASIAPSAN